MTTYEISNHILVVLAIFSAICLLFTVAKIEYLKDKLDDKQYSLDTAHNLCEKYIDELHLKRKECLDLKKKLWIAEKELDGLKQQPEELKIKN